MKRTAGVSQKSQSPIPGIGISEEFQSHIFESFSRERSSTVSGIEGTGLGMGIVKNLVDLMHGTIEVKSKLGEGSTFTVRIPCRISSREETEPTAFDETAAQAPIRLPDSSCGG